MAKTINSFSDKILPRVIQGAESKGILPDGTLAEWTEIIACDIAPSGSPRELNDIGRKILEESGIKKIIDDDLESFIQRLESKRLSTAFDIERQSFYVLKEKENTDLIVPIKSYLYTHPNEEINKIFFVGSMYLRNKYFEKHTDLLPPKEVKSL